MCKCRSQLMLHLESWCHSKHCSNTRYSQYSGTDFGMLYTFSMDSRNLSYWAIQHQATFCQSKSYEVDSRLRMMVAGRIADMCFVDTIQQSLSGRTHLLCKTLQLCLAHTL